MLNDIGTSEGSGPWSAQGYANRRGQTHSRQSSGSTAVEYGLIAAGISVAIITVVAGLGSKLNATFTTIKTGPK
jgi:pilus assembly protein Flp/PilA